MSAWEKFAVRHGLVVAGRSGIRKSPRWLEGTIDHVDVAVWWGHESEDDEAFTQTTYQALLEGTPQGLEVRRAGVSDRLFGFDRQSWTDVLDSDGGAVKIYANDADELKAWLTRARRSTLQRLDRKASISDGAVEVKHWGRWPRSKCLESVIRIANELRGSDGDID